MSGKPSKRLLILTYYWPPSGGSGVQRWLKFCKYLRDFGWEPVVYTVSNGEYPIIDESLAKDIPPNLEVIKTPIWEPYGFYKKFVGQKKEEKIKPGFVSDSEKPKFKEKVARWVRGNLFIPDARRFWIGPSVKYLKKYLRDNPVDAIATTGPPHSVHLIGLKLKLALGLPWLADFRDPWTNIYFYKDLLLSSWADRINHRMEHDVVTKADRVLVVGPTMKEEFEGDHKREITVITNGYDLPDNAFEGIEAEEKFTLGYIGFFMASQNHPALWSALQELCEEEPGVKNDLLIRLVGKSDVVIQEAIRKHGLADNLKEVGYVPHAEVPRYQRSSHVLLLMINQGSNAKGILTGKMFEYLAAKRPVLCMGPADGDAAGIIRETQAGEVLDWGDKNGVKKFLLDCYKNYKAGKIEVDSVGTENYSRKNLTKTLVSVLDEMVGSPQKP